MGRILVTQTPGGLDERFFKEVGKPAGGEEGPLAFEEQPEVGGLVNELSTTTDGSLHGCRPSH